MRRRLQRKSFLRPFELQPWDSPISWLEFALPLHLCWYRGEQIVISFSNIQAELCFCEHEHELIRCLECCQATKAWSEYRSIVEGSLEVKLPTIWTDKQRWEESEKRREEERRSEKRKSQKKEDAGARKGRKVAKHCVFSNVLGLRRVEK